jgi:hypothetical protein
MASVLQDQWNVNARRWCYRRERREVVESAMQASQSKSLILGSIRPVKTLFKMSLY